MKKGKLFLEILCRELERGVNMKVTKLTANEEFGPDGHKYCRIQAITEDNKSFNVDYKNPVTADELKFIFNVLINSLKNENK